MPRSIQLSVKAYKQDGNIMKERIAESPSTRPSSVEKRGPITTAAATNDKGASLLPLDVGSSAINFL